MLELYDTLTRRKRLLKPLRDGLVRIYTCGPSVYAYSHIGNFRTYLFEDVLLRYLRYGGLRVKRVMNITDVEDKDIEAARRERRTFRDIEKDKIRAFFADFNALGMARPDIVAKASEHVPEMVRLIERICARGYCIMEKDGIYFDVRRFKGYGKLAKLKSRRYFGKARGDDYAREGLWDFRLWKKWTRSDGSARWKSPFGYGRPGWHVECSAISMRHLGESFDIHCGGTDNIYPHHENEIAQSESASGRKLANFWLHARHLTINKRKMSKRTGNVLYARQILKMGVHARCLRFYLISERYRKPLDFNWKSFRERACTCERSGRTVKKLRRLGKPGNNVLGRRIAGKLLHGFEDAMDDDLNTGLAFRRIFAALTAVEKHLSAGKLSKGDAQEILKAVERVDSVLGVLA